jgi:hypothetical protein
MPGRGPIHTKKHLSFRALQEVLKQSLQHIPDTRQTAKTAYTLPDCYMSGFAMFFLQDPSLLEFQRRFQHTVQRNNLSTVFGVRRIPGDSQLREVIDAHDYQPLYGVFEEYFRRLQRGKHLEEYRFLGTHYLVSMDGTEYFGSEKVGCSKCLRTRGAKGKLRFHHHVLQATVVAPGTRQVIPLAPEFISNRSIRGVQDCELKAGKRLIPKLRKAHRQLPLLITADSLYSKQSFIRELKNQRMSFILAAKPSDHQSLMADIEGLRRGEYLARLEDTNNKGKHYLYEWVNAIPLNGNPGSDEVNFVEFSISDARGTRTYHNSWVTDIALDEHNVREVVRGGRARWKIENEGFNTLKNHGYHLEHNFGHGSKNLSEAFFVLNLLAFLVHQILELTDRLYQSCRAGFSARKEFWNAIRASFRLLLFDSWEQVLLRMNSPPRPAFGE